VTKFGGRGVGQKPEKPLVCVGVVNFSRWLHFSDVCRQDVYGTVVGISPGRSELSQATARLEIDSLISKHLVVLVVVPLLHRVLSHYGLWWTFFV